jgi:hypothetical protein
MGANGRARPLLATPHDDTGSIPISVVLNWIEEI